MIVRKIDGIRCFKVRDLTWDSSELVLISLYSKNWTHILRGEENVQYITQLRIGQILEFAVNAKPI